MPVTRLDQPTSRVSATETPSQVVASASRGPHRVWANSAWANTPPGAGATPANISARAPVPPLQELYDGSPGPGLGPDPELGRYGQGRGQVRVGIQQAQHARGFTSGDHQARHRQPGSSSPGSAGPQRDRAAKPSPEPTGQVGGGVEERVVAVNRHQPSLGSQLACGQPRITSPGETESRRRPSRTMLPVAGRTDVADDLGVDITGGAVNVCPTGRRHSRRQDGGWADRQRHTPNVRQREWASIASRRVRRPHRPDHLASASLGGRLVAGPLRSCHERRPGGSGTGRTDRRDDGRSSRLDRKRSFEPPDGVVPHHLANLAPARPRTAASCAGNE